MEYYVTVNGVPIGAESDDLDGILPYRFAACQALIIAHTHAEVAIWRYDGERRDRYAVAIDQT